MSSISAHEWMRRHPGVTSLFTQTRLRMASYAMRTVFILAVLAVTLIVSWPQNETIWTVYDTPGDLIRLLLGLAAFAWVAIQIFAMPQDDHAHRVWFFLGLAAVPFALICGVAIW
jgi:hypothetical protein